MKVDTYELPDELLFHKEHMWIKIEGDKAKVGVDDFAQKLAGEISYVQMPFDGDEVSKDDQVGTMETKKWTGNIYSPMSGKVTATNEKLFDDPAIINSDPYGDGWIFEIELSNPDEKGDLMKGREAESWLKSEIEKHA
ncbi:MAG: glycine cleavage system protein GcvH [Candidatus Altiarchaeota archaeon]